MTADELGLLRAVCESPGDDTVRLVLADWYDENGQPDRAAFIRVQVELAGEFRRIERETGWSRGHHTVGTKCRCRLCALRRRERELWDVGTRFGIDTTRFWPVGVRRGFVGSVTCTTATFLAHARVVFAVHPVTRVTLTDREPVRVSGELWEFVVSDARDRPGGHPVEPVRLLPRPPSEESRGRPGRALNRGRRVRPDRRRPAGPHDALK